jgi:cytochrome P450
MISWRTGPRLWKQGVISLSTLQTNVLINTLATPPVDIFSFLHYVPERVFGNWRSRATNVQQEMNKLYGDMLQHVIKRREASGSRGSFLDIVLDQNDKFGFNNHQLYFLGGVMMEGGSDTSSSIIISFVQAITKWQEVQKKAQKEIDAIVGEDRSPVWSDYEKLPYVAATVKEAMRWRPVVPLAFPHALIEGSYSRDGFSRYYLRKW